MNQPQKQQSIISTNQAQQNNYLSSEQHDDRFSEEMDEMTITEKIQQKPMQHTSSELLGMIFNYNKHSLTDLNQPSNDIRKDNNLQNMQGLKTIGNTYNSFTEFNHIIKEEEDEQQIIKQPVQPNFKHNVTKTKQQGSNGDNNNALSNPDNFDLIANQDDIDPKIEEVKNSIKTYKNTHVQYRSNLPNTGGANNIFQNQQQQKNVQKQENKKTGGSCCGKGK